MKKIVFIEASILLAIGIVTMGEALRLIVYKDPQALYDELGPGTYLLVISIALMVTGGIHLIYNYRKSKRMRIITLDKKLRNQMIGTILTFALYTFLVDVLGYLFATVIFFLLEFRIVGVKSWVVDIGLSLLLTATYYAVFVKLCGLVFPRGLLFV